MPDKIYFFVCTENISDKRFALNEQESHHLIKVLRKQVGTNVWLIDGVGTTYYGIVKTLKNNIVSGEILEAYPRYGENEIQITLGIGILKKDKMNLVVEKATECGVAEIVPLLLDRCIKQNISRDRLEKIARSSVKQCGRSVIPIIRGTGSLIDILNINKESALIVCHETGAVLIEKVPNILKKQNKLLLLIGPEGDFTENELDLLKEHNAIFINLGKRRLRSETAVITAMSQLDLYYNCKTI